MRASGCESSANVPSEPTTRMLRKLIGVAGADFLDASVVSARGADRARMTSSTLAVISASTEGRVTG